MRRNDEEEDKLVTEVIAAADHLTKLTRELEALIAANRRRTEIEDQERENDER